MHTLTSPGDPMPDILFVFPPASRKHDFAYHLGAAYVRSYLQQNHVETDQFIISDKETLPDLVARIQQYNSDVIGFTCYDANYPYVRLLSRYLKRRNPHLTIIVGGPTATFSPHVIMTHTPEIDLCIRGEGEQTTLELMQKGFEDLEGIQGITFRSHEIVSTPDRPLISSGVRGKELDILPSPYLLHVVPPDGLSGILSSRGCVHLCTYCNFSIMFNRTIRYHSVDRVISELELIYTNYDPETVEKVSIHDDIFSFDLERAKTICKKIIDREIRLPLSLATRADNCDEELIELMRDANVTLICFGLESASLKVLKNIKKSPNPKRFLKQTKNAVKWSKKAGIKTAVSCIFGLPGEGLEEANKTLDFVRKLKVDEYYHNLLFLFAGTELFETCQNYGLRVTHSPRFLPYETHYAYNAEKVQLLYNAQLNKEIEAWKKMYSDLLTYGVRDDSYSYVILKKMPENAEGVCRWLHDLCVLPLSVVDMTGESVHDTIATLLEGGVPVGLYSVVTGEGQSRSLTLCSQMKFDSYVPEIPFSQWGKGDELVTLEREEDLRALNHFINNHTRNGILHFSAQELPKMVVDACKWGDELCPALQRGYLVIDGEKVLSCRHGQRIGRVGDHKDKLLKAVQDLIHTKEKERNCSDCEVHHECSHCLFPHFFTDEQFCNLKRFTRISRVIPLLEWLHLYAGRSNTPILLRLEREAPPLFYHGNIEKGEPLPELRNNVKLVSFGGNAYVFTGDKSFSLDSCKAAILEACSLHVGKEYLRAYVGEPETIDTLSIFEMLKFFQ